MSRATTKILVGTAVALLSSTAFAESKDKIGWFVGGELAEVTADIDGGTVFDMDNSALGLGAYGGYNFTDLFGLEASIFLTDDLADDREDLRRAETSLLSVMPKLTIPLSTTFSLYAKAGLVYARYAEDYRSVDSYWYDDDASWSDLVWGAGLGAQLEVAPGVNVRFSYDYADGELSEDTYRYSDTTPVRDINLRAERLSLGVHYQF